MADQVVVILDNPSLDPDPWAEQVFADTKLAVVDSAAVIKAMVKDPDAKKALLANTSDPVAAQETLSPYYRAALRQLYGNAPRLGIYGTAWLIHVDNVSACVVDWSELTALAQASKVDLANRDNPISQGMDFVRARVDKYMKDRRRYLELEPPGMPTSERVQRTLAFLREWGV